MSDLLIQGGTVVDGSGLPPRRAEVRVRAGRVVEIALDLSLGEERRIDARGALVTPGFIDPHTHCDPALFWDPACDPLPLHGVSAIVIGNCSLSLAPLPAAQRADLVGAFSFIEDIPPAAFELGIPWSWERWPEYREALNARGTAVWAAGLVGHSALRLAVLGEQAWDRAATAAERAHLAELFGECLDAGAIGLSTSLADVDARGRPVPSRRADDEELCALAAVMAARERSIAFSFIPAWHKLVQAAPAEKRRMLADSWWRGKAREHWDRRSTPFFETEPSARPRLRLRAATTGAEFIGFDELLAQRGGHPSDALADWLLANDLDVEILKWAAEQTEACAALLSDPAILIGSSDSGAHCQSFCGAGDTTFLLTRHVRERGDLSIADAVRRLTSEPAEHFGIRERGRLEPGAVADITVLDLDRLTWLPDELVHDLPGGGSRLRRGAAGYRATIVGGIPVQLDAMPTGALPAGLL